MTPHYCDYVRHPDKRTDKPCEEENLGSIQGVGLAARKKAPTKSASIVLFSTSMGHDGGPWSKPTEERFLVEVSKAEKADKAGEDTCKSASGEVRNS